MGDVTKQSILMDKVRSDTSSKARRVSQIIALAGRIFIPPYTRIKNGRIENVDGYWREVNSISDLRPEELQAVYSGAGGGAIEHVRDFGAGITPTLPRMKHGDPRIAEAYGIAASKTETPTQKVSRLVALAGKIYIPPFTRVNAHGNIEHVDGYWREAGSFRDLNPYERQALASTDPSLGGVNPTSMALNKNAVTVDVPEVRTYEDALAVKPGSDFTFRGRSYTMESNDGEYLRARPKDAPELAVSRNVVGDPEVSRNEADLNYRQRAYVMETLNKAEAKRIKREATDDGADKYGLRAETTEDLRDASARAKEAVLMDLPVDAEWQKAVNAEIARRESGLEANKSEVDPFDQFVNEGRRSEGKSDISIGSDGEVTQAPNTTPSGHRPLYEIAADIRRDWAKPNFAAKPYLDALRDLNDINDKFYEDSAASIVAYFLSNASSWRGEKAKAIKLELKAIQKKGRF